METKLDLLGYKFTFSAIMVLALFLFTAFGLCPLFHILIGISGSYFSYKAYKNKTLFSTPAEKALLGLVIVMMLSIFVNFGEIKHPLKDLFKIKYFLVALLAISALKETFANYMDEKKIRIAANTFILSVTVASIAGLIGYFTGFNPLKWHAVGQTRASGMYGMVMTYAYGLGMVLPILVAALVNFDALKKYINRPLLISAIVLNVVGLYLSYTRGGMLGFLIALPFAFYFTHKKLFKIIIAITGALTIAAVTISILNINIGFYRFAGTQSNSIRMGLYTVAVNMIKEKPILGVGFRNFESSVKQYREKYNLNDSTFTGHAHNNYMEFLGGTGVVGLAFYLAFLFFWCKMLFRDNICPGRLLLPFMASFLLSGLFQSTIIDGENTLLIMFLFGVSTLVCSKKETFIP